VNTSDFALSPGFAGLRINALKLRQTFDIDIWITFQRICTGFFSKVSQQQFG
jgi:hypothetical protein